MLKKIPLAIICVAVSASVVFGAGETGNFLTWGVGARALAMGNAATALADDATAPYWNPSALGRLNYKEISAFYAMLWEDTSFSYLGYAHPLETQGCLGASIVRLYTGGADRRDDNNLSTGSFDDQRIAAGLSYGLPLGPGFYGGATARFITTTMDSYSRDSFTSDFGLSYDASKYVTLGLMFNNLIAAGFSDTDDKLPLVARAGSVFHVLDAGRLLVSVDAGRQFTDGTPTDFYCIGLESRIHPMLALRLGSNQQEMTAGIGFIKDPITIDYAMALHFLGPSHRISIDYRFGENIADARAAKSKPLREIMIAPSSPSRETPAERERRDELEKKFDETYRDALALYRRGQYTKSLEQFTVAQKLDPADPDVPMYMERLNLIVPVVPQVTLDDKTSELLRRGVNYFIDGNGDASVKTVAYALSTEPDNFTISRLLTRIEEKTGIKAEYAKPVSGMSIVDQKLYECLIAFRQKDYSKVINLCEEVLVLEPRNILAYKRIGSAFYALGDKEKAVKSWKKALEIAPDPALKQLILDTQKK